MYKVELSSSNVNISELNNAQLIFAYIYVRKTFNHLYKKKLMNLTKQEKKAIVLVDAVAHIGFDMHKIEVSVEQEKRRIIIEKFPDPEVISVDTNIQYYDVQESGLNKFSTQNYTELNKLAKETITEKISESNLSLLAQQQAIEALDLVEYLAQSMGWHLQLKAFEASLKPKPLQYKKEKNEEL